MGTIGQQDWFDDAAPTGSRSGFWLLAILDVALVVNVLRLVLT